MHVEDLLRLESLDLTLLWGGPPLLAREISGVTATDLEDPGRFLQRGEIVLSGLVWWSAADEEGTADRFVAALRDAGAAALLAGEETHGTVPEVLVDACRRHGVALLSVPVHTSFRAITDAVYLRQWGDLSRRPAAVPYALPENVRGELSRLLADGAAADTLLARAVERLGTPPCYVLSATGRTIARTPGARALPAAEAAGRLKGALRVDPDASPYGQWFLHLPGAVDVPPRMLHEIAEVFAQYRQGVLRREAAGGGPAMELLGLLDTPGPGSGSRPAPLAAALRGCGLPEHGPYTVMAISLGAAAGDGAAEALREAVRHLAGHRSVTGNLAGGPAVAVIAADSGSPEDVVPALKQLWPTLHACDEAVLPYGGISTTAVTPADLTGALVQARYALTAAGRADSANLTAIDDLTTLDALLAGVPTDVRTAFGIHALGPLADATNPSHRMLLETLDTFLTHHGSWARTSEALHLHVNTVHYRIQRVELLTGRDLGRLDHKLDLKAALLCR
ncbi:PucR family transcriptional regulator ligand-binding domain-containing protein [Streptomyces sp. NPDC101178]|uniref:helix-turn-helix domain-containing protein n=1 Tax=Streptomyces sp. NPDC101178 TaxID=3366124 RepID=UPI00382A7747